MNDQRSKSKTEKKYDLEERTTIFAQNILELSKKMPKTITTTPLISQLIRSATSIGANYTEANGASSKKDFRNKIFICKKEAKETMYWLRLLSKIGRECNHPYMDYWREARELALIFSTIARNIK